MPPKVKNPGTCDVSGTSGNPIIGPCKIIGLSNCAIGSSNGECISKPIGPSKGNAWLSNKDIDNTLRNLTKEFPKMYHMEFQMIDFQHKTHPTELGKINIPDDVINKGFNTLAVVINTDTRRGVGEHWFCVFMDFRKAPYTLEYFNSSGRLPYVPIQYLFAKIAKQFRKNKIDYKEIINSGTVHQQDTDSECGVYSLFYIYNRLKGVPPEDINTTRIPDGKMLAFRQHLFR